MDKDLIIQKQDEIVNGLGNVITGLQTDIDCHEKSNRSLLIDELTVILDQVDNYFKSELSALKSAKEEVKSAEEILKKYWIDEYNKAGVRTGMHIIFQKDAIEAMHEYATQFQSVQSKEEKPERKPDWMPDDDRVIGIDIIKRDAEIAHEQTMKNIEDHFKNLEMNLITSANNILRSCYQVIERKGKSTNWEALEKKVKKVLVEQHSYLYPDGKVVQGGLNASQFNPVQSVKGEGERTADQEFAKIKMAIASIQAVYLKMNEDKTFIEANPSNHRIAEYVQFLLNDHKHSESKEQYPVDFLLWIGGQGLYYDKEEKKWFEVGEGGVVYKKSTDELFNHWSTVVTKR